jgi:hypothetical protein
MQGLGGFAEAQMFGHIIEDPKLPEGCVFH